MLKPPSNIYHRTLSLYYSSNCSPQVMFLFSCCTEVQSPDLYQFRAKKLSSPSFEVLSFHQRQESKQIHESVKVLKVKKSQYEDIISMCSQSNVLWQDCEFPCNRKSVGTIDGVNYVGWKRLSEILKEPVLFDSKIEPQDVIQGLLGDCYFLSALSAIAEKQDRIKLIFGQQKGLNYGVYRVHLRINGIIEEIVVDDFVPVNERGQPIFCQPHRNEIWVPILEKAWAKANGSYAAIAAGIPSDIFRAATYAPADTIDTIKSDQNEYLWSQILECAQKNQPCCAGTDDAVDIDWSGVGLVPGHAYTLIDATELELLGGVRSRIIKLRNPWGNTQWEGKGCEKDSKYWSSVVSLGKKNKFLQGGTISNDGIFYILFNDYCHYFAQTHFSYLQEQGNYIYEQFTPSAKKGFYWQLDVSSEGDYWLELTQLIRKDQEIDESRIARSTVVVFKNGEKDRFEFVDGVLGHFQASSFLKVRLLPGRYTVFTKLDATKQQHFPFDACLSVSSRYFVILSAVLQLNSKSIFRDAFLSHARVNKKKKFNNQTMWISWKLFYKQGGYAYLCFGADKQSNARWRVTFNQSDFQAKHFRLKGPGKRGGDNQQLIVMPGEEKIIVVRVKNDNPTQLSWPPKINYKVEMI